MSGAYAGGRLAQLIPGTILLIAFAIIMVVAGVSMLRARTDAGVTDRRLPVLKVVSLGVGIGVVSGLVGAGGGFLLVPALSLLAGIPMPTAVGTSLVVIAVQSYAGLVGHIANENIDWTLAAAVTAATVAGALIGGQLIRRVDPSALRKAFGWLVLLMASLVLAEEVHPAVGATAAALTLSVAAAALACSRYGHCPLRRLADLVKVRTATA